MNSLVLQKLKRGSKKSPFMDNWLGKNIKKFQTIELERRKRLVLGSGDIEHKLM